MCSTTTTKKQTNTGLVLIIKSNNLQFNHTIVNIPASIQPFHSSKQEQNFSNIKFSKIFCWLFVFCGADVVVAIVDGCSGGGGGGGCNFLIIIISLLAILQTLLWSFSNRIWIERCYSTMLNSISACHFEPTKKKKLFTETEWINECSKKIITNL